MSNSEAWIDVGSLNEIPDTGCLETVVSGRVVAVFRIDDRVFALDGLCAHQGGPIADGTLSKTEHGLDCVTCPWHGWQYELATGIQTINRRPLQQTFETRIKGGRIQLRMPPSD